MRIVVLLMFLLGSYTQAATQTSLEGLSGDIKAARTVSNVIDIYESALKGEKTPEKALIAKSLFSFIVTGQAEDGWKKFSIVSKKDDKGKEKLLRAIVVSAHYADSTDMKVFEVVAGNGKNKFHAQLCLKIFKKVCGQDITFTRGETSLVNRLSGGNMQTYIDEIVRSLQLVAAPKPVEPVVESKPDLRAPKILEIEKNLSVKDTTATINADPNPAKMAGKDFYARRNPVSDVIEFAHAYPITVGGWNTNNDWKTKAEVSLTEFGGKLYLAYVGIDDGKINVSYTDNAGKWPPAMVVGQSGKTTDAASLVAYNGMLYLAYKAGDNVAIKTIEVKSTGELGTVSRETVVANDWQGSFVLKVVGENLYLVPKA